MPAMSGMQVGPVQYARNGSVRIAYRVIGDGDVPLVFVPGWISNVGDYDEPTSGWYGFAEHVSSSTRFVVYDKRGTGLSDPVTNPPTIDERMDDLRAVMDAAGVDDASLLGVSEGGPTSLVFAATHRDRVRSLVLYGTAARITADPPDHPWGMTDAQLAEHVAEIDEYWGEGALAELFMGELADVEGVRELFGRAQRSSASPTMAKLLFQSLGEIDVRDVLASVDAPTLVLHRRSDAVVPFEAARSMAEALPNATFTEILPDGPHVMLNASEPLTSAILGFVVGESRTAPSSERMLTTVVFTDIVGSTEAVSEGGDEQWRRRLDTHDEIVDRHLAANGGRKVKDTGDGMLAVFDGPTRAARCALDLVAALATRGIHIRAGVHTGECERRGDDVSGLAVHVGARVGALADADEVLVTRTVRDLSTGSGLVFEDRGTHDLKGVPDAWQVFAVTGGAPTR